MLLGCIADDFTGASDVANTLSNEGLRTLVLIGVPSGPLAAGYDAAVVALKSRSCPAKQALDDSGAALKWLRAQGCGQILFKYCSTFDSTDAGNIGPVAESLAAALGARQVPFCPAFPATGRTLVHGHLFVNGCLLEQTGMRDHPLTPMRDSDLRRVLARQVHGPVGHVPLDVVRDGPAAVLRKMRAERSAGRDMIIADATSDADLRTLGTAFADLALVTGASGIAKGLAENYRARGLLETTPRRWQGQAGAVVALCGSCSETSLAQIEHHRQSGFATRQIRVEALIDEGLDAARLADWALAAKDDIPLIYSSATPAKLAEMHERFGRETCAARLDQFFAVLARHLVAAGVARLVVAGGETSGAVVAGLGLERLEIGPEIAPGVPAMRAHKGLVLTLKSGNFGERDFFGRAASLLGETNDRQ